MPLTIIGFAIGPDMSKTQSSSFDIQRRDDFRYANGPAYCISETLMMKVEKYMRYVLNSAAIKDERYRAKGRGRNRDQGEKERGRGRRGGREGGRKRGGERERERERDLASSCRGKNFEDHCRKSQASMDDILPGVIIDAVLGIDMNETLAFKGQLDDIVYYNSNDPEELKRLKKEVQVTYNIGNYT